MGSPPRSSLRIIVWLKYEVPRLASIPGGKRALLIKYNIAIKHNQNMIYIEENDQKLDGVLSNTGQGQEGKIPSWVQRHIDKGIDVSEYPKTKEEAHYRFPHLYIEHSNGWTVDEKLYFTTADKNETRYRLLVECQAYNQEKQLQQLRRDNKKQKKHAGYELGAREFTLTYSPNWEGFNETIARQRMEVAITRLLNYYST